MTQISAALNLNPVLKWLGFVAMCVGMFMAILDIQVVITALPLIENELQIGVDQMSWLQTAYIIAEVIAIPLTGLLMRVYSMRLLFVIASLGFTLASIGCSASTGFASLLLWRIAQGFCGGLLIPLVFSAIFLLFNKGLEQTIATTVGGVLAVLAPAVGPITGGWLTDHFSWQWIFLINVIPGVASAFVGFFCLPLGSKNFSLIRNLDWMSLLSFAVCLAFLIVGLKEAPVQGWFSAVVLMCFGLSLIGLLGSMGGPNPVIMYGLLKDRALAYGCAVSFILGIVLFSSVYIPPVFLAFVHGMKPLEIGVATLIMGIAQLVSAPLIVQVDRFLNARGLAAVGFLCFAVGLFMNANLTVSSTGEDFWWPLLVRGASIALCILPPIRFALSLIPIGKVSDASGIFNVSRNVGGAIGIALTDTILFSRSPVHAEYIADLMTSDPVQAARLMGVSQQDLPDMSDPSAIMGSSDLIQAASLTLAVNETWIIMGGITLLALPLLIMMGPTQSALPLKFLVKLKESSVVQS